MPFAESEFRTFVMGENGRNRTESSFFQRMSVLLQLVDKANVYALPISESPLKRSTLLVIVSISYGSIFVTKGDKLRN